MQLPHATPHSSQQATQRTADASLRLSSSPSSWLVREPATKILGGLVFSLFVCFCFVCLFVAGFWEDGGPEPVSFIWPHSLSYSCASQWLLCIDSSPYGTKLFHVVLFFVYIYYIYLYVHHTVHVWRRSEDNFKESVLSFHSVGTEVLKSGQSFAFKTRSM